MIIASPGSTGFVCKLLIHKTVGLGHQVKTLSGNPEKLDDISDKTERIQESVFGTSSAEAPIVGTDADLPVWTRLWSDRPGNG